MSDWDRLEALATRMQFCRDELAAIAAEATPFVDRVDAIVLRTASEYVGEIMEQTGFLPLTHFNITDFGEQHRDLVPVADAPIRCTEELAT
jgi:hypothetical protein